MDKQFYILKKIRNNLLQLISEIPIEHLNEIPTRFKNNIAWNLGHLVASQQAVCYLCAGLSLAIDEKYFERYKSGTEPGKEIGRDELETTKQLFLSAIDQMETDYQNNLFSNYTPWTNRYGVEISTIEEALDYVIFHEGLHLGYVMALKHLVKN